MFESKLKSLEEKSNKLPLIPGVYIMKDASGKIIYIGKAKKLRNRVSQYFKNVESHNIKVYEMVSRVDNFEYIITNTEFEALVLECSLIKKYKPKYNILLKDDKGYYYIKITNEDWPRLKSAKVKLLDNAKYIGPYTSIGFVSQILDSAIKIFKLPICNKKFSENYKDKRARACLNYYIGQCNAPCIGKIKFEDYIKNIKNAQDFLTKSNSKIIKDLTLEMKKSADELKFERAAAIRDQINTIKKINENKQKVILSTVKKDIDVIAFYQENLELSLEKYKETSKDLEIKNNKTINSISCFKVFNYSGGKLTNSSEYIFENIINTEPMVLSEFIGQYYLREDAKIPQLVLTNILPEYKETLENWLTKKRKDISKKKVNILCPKTGDFHKIIDMCSLNAKEIVIQKIKMDLFPKFKNENILALESLKKLLNLQKLPKIIESYDISNLKDSDVVGGMVVFNEGVPYRSMYKKFKIKSFVGQDDYRAMSEVITRRFKEYEKSKENNINNGFEILPDLIFLDGGKGHVSTVKLLLETFSINIPVFGMVKDKKHKTRALTSEYKEINIKDNSSIYKLIYKIQEEVHRYTINYNKTLRNKNLKLTALPNIPGIGEKLANKLMSNFKTLKNIKMAPLEDILKIKGMSKKTANKVKDFLKSPD